MTDLSSRADLRNVRETRAVPFDAFELREKPNGSGGTDLTFSGLASVTEAPYEMQDFAGPYTEVVRAGAFTKTLSEKPDVMFLLNHEGMPLARTKSGTLTLSEQSEGLHAEARLAADSVRVQEIRSAIERRDMDEMSFAFRVTRQQWSPDFDQRDILEVNLNQGDVSLVNYGANGHTGGTVSLRSRQAARALRGVGAQALVDAFGEIRAGKALSSSTMAALTAILQLVDDADTNVDNALIQLSDLMGVVNPDIAQDAALERSILTANEIREVFGLPPVAKELDSNDNELWLMQRRNNLRKHQGPPAA